MLPNSLTRVLSFALVYSTRLPVSVCGTSTRELCLETFLGNKAQPLRLTARSHLSSTGGFTYQSQHLDGSNPNPIMGWPTSLRPPIALSSGSGMLTGCPSPTPLGLG